MTKTEQKTQAGFAAIIGAPNAGKSTLLNQLVGHKISIVSHKAQTTRLRVLGLLNEGPTQVGLVDTPGLFTKATGSTRKLDKVMTHTVWQSLEDADVILLLVDAAIKQPTDETEVLLSELKRRNKKAVLVLNKVDKIKLEKLLPLTEMLNETGLFDTIFMVSALTGDGVSKLKEYLFKSMPLGPWLYPEDELSDLPERLLAAEVTREQIFRQLHDELPYATAVLPEKWESRKDGSVAIHQTILVTRPGQRAIVLGKDGAQIKSLGQAARKEMAVLLGRTVHLFLDVKVDENWQEKGEFYRLFGLDE